MSRDPSVKRIYCISSFDGIRYVSVYVRGEEAPVSFHWKVSVRCGGQFREVCRPCEARSAQRSPCYPSRLTSLVSYSLFIYHMYRKSFISHSPFPPSLQSESGPAKLHAPLSRIRVYISRFFTRRFGFIHLRIVFNGEKRYLSHLNIPAFIRSSIRSWTCPGAYSVPGWHGEWAEDSWPGEEFETW